MVCCADIRYGSADAWFSVKEIDLGMVADVGTLQRLPRLMGDGLVRELAYTGRRMDAQEAAQAGFLTRVFPDREALLAGVMEIARGIAARSPLAVRGTKEVILYGRDHSVEDGLRYIANWNAGMLSADDLTRSLTAGGKPEGIAYSD
jgi:enoyl-CoA hydratase